jgi:hypothetical protein
MTQAEMSGLAEQAFTNLDVGAWEGFVTPNGGWRDTDAGLDAWHAAASDFMAQWAAGDRTLTEGLICGATFDLACELAWLRGWCPQRLSLGSSLSG